MTPRPVRTPRALPAIGIALLATLATTACSGGPAPSSVPAEDTTTRTASAPDDRATAPSAGRPTRPPGTDDPLRREATADLHSSAQVAAMLHADFGSYVGMSEVTAAADEPLRDGRRNGVHVTVDVVCATADTYVLHATATDGTRTATFEYTPDTGLVTDTSEDGHSPATC